MGIHWRTRVIGPNLAALAQAGWSQQGWSGPPRAAEPAADLAAAGGQPADFPTSTILGAGANARVYQTCRLGNLAYRLDMPDGTYDVTLMFAELQYDAPGKRVFDVKINGKTVLDKLDIFAAAGKDLRVGSDVPGHCGQGRQAGHRSAAADGQAAAGRHRDRRHGGGHAG